LAFQAPIARDDRGGSTGGLGEPRLKYIGRPETIKGTACHGELRENTLPHDDKRRIVPTQDVEQQHASMLIRKLVKLVDIRHRNSVNG